MVLTIKRQLRRSSANKASVSITQFIRNCVGFVFLRFMMSLLLYLALVVVDGTQLRKISVKDDFGMGHRKSVVRGRGVSLVK